MRDVSNFKSWRALGLALVVGILAGCGGNSGSSDNASLRLVNATLTHPSLDLLASSAVAISANPLDQVSNYASVGTGSVPLQINDAGAASALASTTPTLSSGQHYAVIAYESGGVVTTALLGEDTAQPAAGLAQLRVFDVSPDAGAVDVYITGTATDLASVSPSFSTVSGAQPTAFLAFTPGTYRLRVTGAGNKADLRADIPTFALASQQVASAILTPAAGGVLLNGSVLIQQGSYAAARNTNARVRLAASVSGGATVAASVGSTPIDSGMLAPAVGSYVLVPAATALSVTVNGAAASVAGTGLQAGSDSTLLVYGAPGAAAVSTLTDDNHLPAVATNIKMRLVNGLSGGGGITLTASFAVVASNVAPGSASAYAQVPGSTSTQINVTSGATLLYSLPKTGDPALSLPGNGVYTLFMLGDATATPPLTGLLRRDQ